MHDKTPRPEESGKGRPSYGTLGLKVSGRYSILDDVTDRYDA